MALNTESRTRNAGKNAISAILNRIIVLLLTFISRKFFIQYIGVEYLGINGLFSNVLTLLSMADLGLGTAMNVSLYKPIAKNDTRRITALLNYFKKLYIYIAVGVMIVGLVLLPFLRYLVNMERDIPYLYVYYVVFVLKNTASYLFIYKASLLRADQKAYLINKIEVYVNTIKVLTQMVIVIVCKSYFIYIAIDVFAVILLNLFVSKTADQQYEFLNNKNVLQPDEKKEIFTDISSVFLYKIAWSLLNGTDNILMSVIVGTVYVGYYSNYFTITNNIETFIALLFTSLTASIGNLVAVGTEKQKYKIFQSMQMVSFWICGIVCVCLFYLLQDFITIWLGKAFLLDNLTLTAIVVNVFFSLCMRPVWTFREGTGMYQQIRYIMFVTAILNLILSIFLGKKFGVCGILFATAISKLVTYFWYEPYLLFKNFFNAKPYKYYFEYIKNAGVLLVCGLICYMPMQYIVGENIVCWMLKAVICLAVVNGMYLLRYMKTEEFRFMKEKVVHMIKR